MSITPLLGIHVLEDVQDVTLSRDHVEWRGQLRAPRSVATLLKIDGEVVALFHDGRDGEALSSLRLARMPSPYEFPFSQEHVAESALQMAHQPNRRPVVCNFFRRPGAAGLPGNHAIYAVDESSGNLVLKIRATPARGNASMITLSSHLPVLPGARVNITSRPQSIFYPRRLVIYGQKDFLVRDLRIGTRSQLPEATPIPASSFALTSASPIAFDAMSPGRALEITAEYVGDDDAGQHFQAALTGFHADDDYVPAGVATRWTREGRWEPWMTRRAER